MHVLFLRYCSISLHLSEQHILNKQAYTISEQNLAIWYSRNILDADAITNKDWASDD